MNDLCLVPANGMGDAIILAAIGSQLQKSGWNITLFHRMASDLSAIFPTLKWHPFFSQENKSFHPLTLIQNDHSLFTHTLHKKRICDGIEKKWRFLLPKKSALATPYDLALDPQIPLFLAIQTALSKELKIECSPWIPQPRHHNSTHSTTIAIHPWSGKAEKNWPHSSFYALGLQLEKRGFTPLWIMTEKERETWCALYPDMKNWTPLIRSTAEMAGMLETSSFFIGNDSGVGHLASYLGIQTLTISPHPKQMQQWKPSFSSNIILTPPCVLPSFRTPYFPLRRWIWHYFVPVNRVLKAFLEHRNG